MQGMPGERGSSGLPGARGERVSIISSKTLGSTVILERKGKHLMSHIYVCRKPEDLF